MTTTSNQNLMCLDVYVDATYRGKIRAQIIDVIAEINLGGNSGAKSGE